CHGCGRSIHSISLPVPEPWAVTRTQARQENPVNRTFATSIATLALSFLASACGDADETSQGQQSATSGSSSSSAASSSGASSSTGGQPPDGFGFQPSNLPADFPIDEREDVVIDGQ